MVNSAQQAYLFYGIGAVSKHISSYNRFFARADPPGGGGGLVTPLVGRGGGGLALGENCREPAAPLKVF
jgi:hypothetical protein